MEAVIFDGKEYIKASVLAERFNYTQDYLGQLCRGKKVDARLVGRAWYVNLDSLNNHKKARYKATPDNSLKKGVASTNSLRSKNEVNYLSRIDVEPVLKKKTVKIIKNEAGKMSEIPVKYENDDYSLIPKVSRDAVYKPLKVLPAEAEDMPVKASAESVRTTSFKAEPLPEVYLKGVLKVDGIPEMVEEHPESEIVNQEQKINVEPERRESPAKISQMSVDVKKPLKIKLYRNNEHTTKPAHVDIDKEKHTAVIPTKIVNRTREVSKTIAPERQIPVKRVIQTVELPTPNPEIHSKRAEEQTFIPYATLKAGVLFFLCLFIAAGFLVSEKELLVTKNSVATEWLISSDLVRDIAAFRAAF